MSDLNCNFCMEPRVQQLSESAREYHRASCQPGVSNTGNPVVDAVIGFVRREGDATEDGACIDDMSIDDTKGYDLELLKNVASMHSCHPDILVEMSKSNHYKFRHGADDDFAGIIPKYKNTYYIVGDSKVFEDHIVVDSKVFEDDITSDVEEESKKDSDTPWWKEDTDAEEEAYLSKETFSSSKKPSKKTAPSFNVDSVVQSFLSDTKLLPNISPISTTATTPSAKSSLSVAAESAGNDYHEGVIPETPVHSNKRKRTYYNSNH